MHQRVLVQHSTVRLRSEDEVQTHRQLGRRRVSYGVLISHYEVEKLCAREHEQIAPEVL